MDEPLPDDLPLHARFLHDVPVQILTAATMQLQIEAERGPVDANKAQSISFDITRAVQSIHELMQELAAPPVKADEVRQRVIEHGAHFVADVGAAASDEAAAAIVSTARILLHRGSILRLAREDDRITLKGDLPPTDEALHLARLLLEPVGGEISAFPGHVKASVPAAPT